MRTAALFASGAVLAALLIPGPAAATTAVGAAERSASVSKAEARKLVNAGVVKKTDVRDFTAEKYVADPATEQAMEQALYSCLGGKPPKKVASKDGPTLSKGMLSIDSGAAVIATLKQAKADVKLAKSKKAPRCLKKAIIASFAAQGATVHGIRVTAVKLTVPGADTAFGFRYDVTATAGDIAIDVLGYDLDALVGQTELNVSPARYDARDSTLKQGISLLSKTVKRVRALS